MQEKIFIVHWILSQYRENFCSFAVDKHENNFLSIRIMALKRILIRLQKTIAVHRKYTKIFFLIGFVVYGIKLATAYS